jgi:prevent-host-death family protein
MARLAVSKAHEAFSGTINRVAKKKQRIVLQRRGKDVAALVPLEDLALLEELEDRQDLEDFRAAKEEWERDGRKTIPWEKVKADLGL